MNKSNACDQPLVYTYISLSRQHSPIYNKSNKICMPVLSLYVFVNASLCCVYVQYMSNMIIKSRWKTNIIHGSTSQRCLLEFTFATHQWQYVTKLFHGHHDIYHLGINSLLMLICDGEYATENRNLPFPQWKLYICGDYISSVLIRCPHGLCDTDGCQTNLTQTVSGSNLRNVDGEWCVQEKIDLGCGTG